MNILLINPDLPKFIRKQKAIYPPLGLLYIASVLENKGHTVKIMDFLVEQTEPLSKIIGSFKPNIAGFYSTTHNFTQCCKLLSKIKEVDNNIVSIIGGPLVASYPIESLMYSQFDYAVVGEGETTVVELANAISAKRPVGNIKGIVYRENKKIKQTHPRRLIQNIDEIPFPSWNLVDLKKYSVLMGRKNLFATIMTSRGCPHNCIFCNKNNGMGKNWRCRTPGNIFAEIKILYEKYKIRHFTFFDENFIVNKNRVLELCNLIINDSMKIKWDCKARVDSVEISLLKKMKQAGCHRIRYGAESGNNKILKELNKGITVEQIRDCAAMTKEAGIELFVYFMMGSPSETIGTLKQTYQLAVDIDADFAIFSKTIPIPGSELFRMAVKNKQIEEDYWLKFIKGEEKNPEPNLTSQHFSDKELGRLIKLYSRNFYIRQGYLVKRLFLVRSLPQFKRLALIGIKLLGNKFSNPDQ